MGVNRLPKTGIICHDHYTDFLKNIRVNRLTQLINFIQPTDLHG